MASLSTIEGIGPDYAAKLNAAGCNSVEELLEMGGTAKGRAALAASSGASEKLILGWVNRADLMRVKGIGEQYSDLLEEAGVDTVAELAQRNAANLTKAMADVNEKRNLVKALPTEDAVEGWIAHAKTLPKAVSH